MSVMEVNGIRAIEGERSIEHFFPPHTLPMSSIDFNLELQAQMLEAMDRAKKNFRKESV